MVGVHTLNSVAVTNGASLSFGDDTLVLERPELLTVDADSSLFVGTLDFDTLDYLAANNQLGNIQQTQELIRGDLEIVGERSFDTLDIDSLIVTEGSTLQVNALTAVSYTHLTLPTTPYV